MVLAARMEIRFFRKAAAEPHVDRGMDFIASKGPT
jgi:hypothetical protein